MVRIIFPHRVEEKSLYSVGGRGPVGEAKNTVPPNTWSGTRPGIIIIANLLPNMLGAGMHGNVRGASCWCIGGILGLVRGVPH